MENYKKEWQNTQHKDTITISKTYFEDLINSIGNQKFVNGEPSLDHELWRKGVFIRSLSSMMKLTHKRMFEKYCKFWNKNRLYIINFMNQDTKQFPNDKNIDFKWGHLVGQETEMWIRLCCFSYSTIDCENEKYIHGNVSLEDFNDIVNRRGFTPRMRIFLIAILKDIGIGDNLKNEK